MSVRFAVTSCVVAVVLTVLPTRVAMANRMLRAGTVLPGITPNGGSYLDLAQDISGGSLCWVEGRIRETGATTNFGGIFLDGSHVLCINPEVHDSSGRHIDVIRVGNGTNYMTDPGEIRNVSAVALDPNVARDASVFTLSGAPLTVPSLVPALPPPSSSFTPIKFAGWGTIQIGSDPFLPQDGFARGGEAEIGGPFPFYDPAVFASAIAFDDEYFTAAATPGDSGGIVRDSAGNFIGQIEAGNSVNGGVSTIFRMNTPAFVEWYSSAVPEPGSMLLLLSAAGVALVRRRRRTLKN